MKYDFLISHMTLEEKASLMSGADFWSTKAVPTKGIPSLSMSDGPHGLRKQNSGEDSGYRKRTSVPATCYPTASALANTWDEQLVEKLGEELGAEAKALNTGILLGPGVNIKRNPLCGRNFEYYSEDPFLTGKMAAALIRGIQSTGVAACVKHFAANSQETLRMSSDSVLDERTLREIYLPAFEMAVKEGKSKAVMSSYNRVNGTYANENVHLLKEILREDWGFDGVVISDWGANNNRVAALKAGATLEMPSSNGITDKQIVAAVRSGELDEDVLNEQVDRLLRLVFEERKVLDAKRERPDMYRHHLTALDAAAAGAVLLKNEDSILPISDKRTVAVLGDFAEKPRYQGAGSSEVNAWNPIIPLEALRSEQIQIKGYAKAFERNGKKNTKLLKEAVALAKTTDCVLLYLGLREDDEAEGHDRTGMKLPSVQIRVLDAVSAVNPNVIVVLSCGAPVEMNWDGKCRAIIYGCLSGQAGAAAIAQLISGKRNFCGKLAETIPEFYEDIPSSPYYPGKESTAEYREGIYVGYRYFSSANVPVKYPFGYGLSYTDFSYSNLRIENGNAVFSLKNTGNMAGAEIAQLYISLEDGKIFRPQKELKGFAKVFLLPGEERTVSIPLNDRSFSVWSVLEHNWVVEPGKYTVSVGASVEDLRLGAEIVKTGPFVENPYRDPLFSAWYSVEPEKVSDGAFRALLGHTLPERDWSTRAKLDVNSPLLQGINLVKGPGRLIWRLISFWKTAGLIFNNQKAAVFADSALSMTYRTLARFSGRVTDKQLSIILKIINNEEGIISGLKQFAAEEMKEK